ncbi:DUF4173 domain-containing protein [soil metagenome]
MTATTAAPPFVPPAPPARFWVKVGIALVFIALAEWLFFAHEAGSLFGGFLLAWTAATIAVQPGFWKNRAALFAGAISFLLCLITIDRPSPVGVLLFSVSLSMTALLSLIESFDDLWLWGQRLVLHGFISLVGPLLGVWAYHRALPAGQSRRLWTIAPVVLAPLIGGAVFLALFASANPIISDALEQIRLPRLDFEFIARVVFGGMVLVAVWSTLSPHLRAPFLASSAGIPNLPGLTLASVTASLVVFNAIFAIQNILDVAFLWSGAALPSGVTLADYAHRGAYPLIVTALLAGLFVLVALRPGSETARRPLVTGLVVLWIVQNIFLVASSMLRTLDYVGAYSLTRMRIAALIWMVLVAVGLALICWRLVRAKSPEWLLGANAVAVGAVLIVCSIVDLGSIAAGWNITHAREVGGKGAGLDLCYLQSLGSTGVVSLVELEKKAIDSDLKDRVAYARLEAVDRLAGQQSDYHGWTWRNARRLQKVEDLRGDAAWTVSRTGGKRFCNGVWKPVRPTVEIPATPTSPLTPAPVR